MQEEITFKGHPNVRCLHNSTLEITTEPDLTPNGDCIVGVSASKGCSRLHTAVKKKLSKDDCVVRIQLIVEPYTLEIFGATNSNLLLTHPHDIVIRKSNYIDARTLSIRSNISCADVPYQMAYLLKNPSTIGLMRIIVE
jgi:uncharacterized protein